MNWKRGESSSIERPLEVDDQISSTTVYLRRNIERVQKTDSMSNHTYEMWTYEEQQIPKEDWAMYKQLMETKGDVENTDMSLFELAAIISEHEQKLQQLGATPTVAHTL